MKALLKTLIVLAVLVGGGTAAYIPAHNYWAERNRPKWREAEVQKRDLVADVRSTGEVLPVQKIHIGSFVSGPVVEVNVDFNDRVKEGDLLAKIDKRLIDANVRSARAVLQTQQAEVERVTALLQQAINNERRAKALQKENPEYISGSEMDQYTFATLSLDAQLTVAEASVDQAKANLENAEANLGYTDITSPVDGIVIDKLIDTGQTLASQFQTPEMFVVAVDMDKEMHVFASVDEADIGMIMNAKEEGQPVEFTVDAWPGELFKGRIEQIRVSSTVTQNVVTYPVVVVAPNPGMKLLPGMTAQISFRVDERKGVVSIPNAALRFFPSDAKYVRESDRELLSGAAQSMDEDVDQGVELSAAETVEAKKRQHRKHVWVVDGEFLKAIEVVTGLNDTYYTEMVSGALEVGQKLVTGLKAN